MCVFGAMDGKRFVVCCLHLEILVWMLLAFVVQLSDEANPGDGKERQSPSLSRRLDMN